MAIDALYIGNDTILELANLANAVTGAYINDATVTAVVKNAAGAAVTGMPLPLTMSYVGDGEGTYRGTLWDTLVVTENSWYTAEIIAIGGGLTGFWSHRMMAVRRT